MTLKKTNCDCFTCQLDDLLGGPWPLRAAMESVSLTMSGYTGLQMR